MSFQARQGDILIREVSAPPSKANLKSHNSNIVAYGEVTGHSHVLVGPQLSDMDSVVDENGDIFVKSHVPVKLNHDEHSSIELPANTWLCISRQREYDYLSAEQEKERKVRD